MRKPPFLMEDFILNIEIKFFRYTLKRKIQALLKRYKIFCVFLKTLRLLGIKIHKLKYYELSRKIIGVHFLSDEEVVRQIAHKTLMLMWYIDKFKKYFEATKSE